MTVEKDQVEELYDMLWLLAQRGAITAAAKIYDASRYRQAAQQVELTEAETYAFLKAIAKLKQSPPSSADRA